MDRSNKGASMDAPNRAKLTLTRGEDKGEAFGGMPPRFYAPPAARSDELAL
jgi:hypothetical protein